MNHRIIGALALTAMLTGGGVFTADIASADAPGQGASESRNERSDREDSAKPDNQQSRGNSKETVGDAQPPQQPVIGHTSSDRGIVGTQPENKNTPKEKTQDQASSDAKTSTEDDSTKVTPPKKTVPSDEQRSENSEAISESGSPDTTIGTDSDHRPSDKKDLPSHTPDTSASENSAASASELCPNNVDGYGAKINTDGDPASVFYPAPTGKLIAAYCVKAGTTIETKFFADPVESVTIEHSSKDSVSHYSLMLVDGTTTPTDDDTGTDGPDGNNTGGTGGGTGINGPGVVEGGPGANKPGVVGGDGGVVPPPLPPAASGEETPDQTPTVDETAVAGDGGPVPTKATPTGALPQTGGSGSFGILQVGALLLLAGAAAILATRRRNAEPTA